MKSLESYLRHLITELIRESNDGSDLTPPEPSFVARKVAPRSLESLNGLQLALNLNITGEYDYQTEKAWDDFVYKSGNLKDADLEGATLLEIATDWSKAGPKIKKLFGNSVSYTDGIKGMLKFVKDVKKFKTGSELTRSTDPGEIQDSSPDDDHLQTQDSVQALESADVSESVIKKPYNFHKIPAGNNNWRSAQIPLTENGKEVFRPIIENYGIKTIIRLNGNDDDEPDELSVEDEKALADSMDVKFYRLSPTRKQDEVNALLDQGNVLIHCAHGADRTGGNVGAWLQETLGWDTDNVWKYTIQYNGWNNLALKRPGEFVRDGYLKQAQKFGVRDLGHAQELAKKYPKR
jgi:hypothetical protein